MFGEYLHVADTTGRECLKKYCKPVIQIFGPSYLRKPTAQDSISCSICAGGCTIFRDAGKHRLYELSLEELSDCLKRPVYYRVQRHAPDHHSGRRYRPATMDLACVLRCVRVKQRPQCSAVLASLQRPIPRNKPLGRLQRQRQPVSYEVLLGR